MDKKKIILISSISGATLTLAATALVISLAAGSKKNKGYRTIKAFNIDGNVVVTRKNKAIQATEKMNFLNDDTIEVKDNSSITLKLDDDKFVHIKENTTLHLVATGKKNNTKTRLFVEDGGVIVDVKNKLKEDESFEIASSNSVMAIRGTQVEFDVTNNTTTTDYSMSVIRGLVELYIIQPNSDGYELISIDQAAGENYELSVPTVEQIKFEDINTIFNGDYTSTKMENSNDFVTELTNYNATNRELTVEEINKVKDVIDEYATELVNNEWENVLSINSVYEGEEFKPSAKAKYGEVTYKYSTDNITFTDIVPTNPGKYYVKAYVLDENYALESEERIFWIVTINESNLEAEYYESFKDFKVKLGDGWSVDSTSNYFERVGINNINVIHESGLTKEVTVNVVPAKNTWVTNPTIKTGTTFLESLTFEAKAKYGEVVARVILLEDGDEIDSTDYSPNLELPVGDYRLVLEVLDSRNYEGIEKSIDFSVSKADVVLIDNQGNKLSKEGDYYILNMEYSGDFARLDLIYEHEIEFNESFPDSVNPYKTLTLIDPIDGRVELANSDKLQIGESIVELNLVNNPMFKDFNALIKVNVVTAHHKYYLGEQLLTKQANGLYNGGEFPINADFVDILNNVYVSNPDGSALTTVAYCLDQDFIDVITNEEMNPYYFSEGTYYARIIAGDTEHCYADVATFEFKVVDIDMDQTGLDRYLSSKGLINNGNDQYFMTYNGKGLDLKDFTNYFESNSANLEIGLFDYNNDVYIDNCVISNAGNYTLYAEVSFEYPYESITRQIDIIIERENLFKSSTAKNNLANDGWVLEEETEYSYVYSKNYEEGYELTQEDLIRMTGVDLSRYYDSNNEYFNYDNSNFTKVINESVKGYTISFNLPVDENHTCNINLLYKAESYFISNPGNASTYNNWYALGDTEEERKTSRVYLANVNQMGNYPTMSSLSHQYGAVDGFFIFGKEPTTLYSDYYQVLNATYKFYSPNGTLLNDSSNPELQFPESTSYSLTEVGDYKLVISLDDRSYSHEDVTITVRCVEPTKALFKENNSETLDIMLPAGGLSQEDILAMITSNNSELDDSDISLMFIQNDNDSSRVDDITTSGSYLISLSSPVTTNGTPIDNVITLNVYTGEATISWASHLGATDDEFIDDYGYTYAAMSALELKDLIEADEDIKEIKIFYEGEEVEQVDAMLDEETSMAISHSYTIRVTTVANTVSGNKETTKDLILTGLFQA